MKKTFLTFLALFLLLATVWGQTSPMMSLTEIPTLRKLPVNAIHRVFQDSEGYMWYGTVNGLCRDDGYRIQVFRADFNHPGRLDDNLIECITEDLQRRIWFGTDKGAYILDKKDYTIRRVEHPKLNGRLVNQAYTTTDGNVWLSTEGTMLRFASPEQCIKEYETYNKEGAALVAGFCESRNGDIIVCISESAVCRLDRKTDTLVPFDHPSMPPHPGSIIQDSEQDYFWMCTWGEGLVRFNPSAVPDSMFVYQHPVTPVTGSLMFLAQDKSTGRLWITSTTRLLVYDVVNGKARLSDDNDLLSSYSMLNEIIRDNKGDFWVSAFDCPSFILHNRKDGPRKYALPALKAYSEYRPAVMALCDAGDGMVWLFQERCGIFLYDLENDRAFCHKDFSTTMNLPFGMVKLMAESRTENTVWISPQYKLQAYRLKRNGMNMSLTDMVDFASYTHDDAMSSLHEDMEGKFLYAGTHKGLFRHDLHTGQTKAVCDTMGHVTGIIETDDHTLYVCTYDKGIYALSPEGGIRHYPLTQAFSCITRTTDGLLWLGSDEGDLISMNPHDGTTQDYNRTCNLNGDMINRVVADDFNHIWIDTNQKIIEFNPHNGSFRTHPTTDGSLNLWRLIPTALCKGMDGTLYFGGIPGICRFTPSNILEREASDARVVITDLRSDGRSLFFDKNRTCVAGEVFEISADESNLTICFSSLNHRTAHKIRYAYRLKGIDKQWQYVALEEPEARYGHLTKGTYEFEVKATDNNGQWSRTVTVFRFHRLPAWYETWWIYLIYIIGITSCIGYGVFRYIRRMQHKNDELWADSEEMLRMRDYLNRTSETEMEEHGKLDKLFIDKAVKIVEENLSEPDFDVQRLADGMNMSRSTLTRKLKSVSGDTPLDFIRHIKMKHARHMLEDSGRNISEVAATLGYYNRKYFTTCFKEEFGMTPSEYQKNVRTTQKQEACR